MSVQKSTNNPNPKSPKGHGPEKVEPQSPEAEPHIAGDLTLEVEVKLRVDDLGATLAGIHSAGFRELEPRSFESNVVFDDAGRSLMAAKKLLRVREYRGETVLTFKGSPLPGRHKQREEIETTVSSSKAFADILNRLGYNPTFRYEKFRTVFSRQDTECVVTVDETPIGPFLELEGEPGAIDRVALELGFAPEDYITASYATLSQEYFAANNIPAGDFVFSRMPDCGRESG